MSLSLGGDYLKFNNYTHFKNYCLKIAKNKEYIVCDEYLQIFDEFEVVVSLLKELEDNNIIKLQNNIFDVISNYFKNENFKVAFSDMKYLINKIYKFSREEEDFYYITTALNTMLNLGLEFEEDFILNSESTTSIFYPSRVKGLEVKRGEEKIYTINEIDFNYRNKYGVYFIYNHENELVYIGKSSNCLLTRAFESAKERECLNFSKIELRECKSKSDIAIYESYYISLYKPQFNNDLVFDDTPTVKLPELPISKLIARDVESEYVTSKYTYFIQRVMDIKEFINLVNKNYALLDTTENIELLKNKGIYTKYEMQQKAYADNISKIKNSGNCTSTFELSRELSMRK